MAMGNSSVKTLAVPFLGEGASNGPGPLVIAGPRPLRVLVRNVGAQPVLVAYDASAFNSSSIATGATFTLPLAVTEVFVLAPRQALYAIALGGGPSLVSVAISEAIGEVEGGENFRASVIA